MVQLSLRPPVVFPDLGQMRHQGGLKKKKEGSNSEAQPNGELEVAGSLGHRRLNTQPFG